MKKSTAKRLILVTALETEVQGMIAENAERISNHLSPSYTERDFSHMAAQMRSIANFKNKKLNDLAKEQGLE